jgi:hypothetical protein
MTRVGVHRAAGPSSPGRGRPSGLAGEPRGRVTDRPARAPWVPWLADPACAGDGPARAGAEGHLCRGTGPVGSTDTPQRITTGGPIVRGRGDAAPLSMLIAGLVAVALMIVGWGGTVEVAPERAAAPATTDAAPPADELHVPDESVQPVAMEEPDAADEPDEPEGIPEVDRIETSAATRAAFEERYSEQADATADNGRWALIVGINQHLGAVADNYVSREDAELLREVLLDAGWDDARILLITDTDATGDMIREGLSWLARKAGDDATTLFHYSGHSKKWYGGGGAIQDIALWPTDDDFIRSDELAASLGEVRHAQLWGNLVTCNAEGFHEAGLGGEGRVLTYSSRTAEKSYEDPGVGNTVFGSFFLEQALWRNGEGPAPDVASVQDAFELAAPQATERTSQQRYGPQRPVIYDDLGEPFRLEVE